MIKHLWLQCRSFARKQKIFQNGLSKALLRLKILLEYREVVNCQTRAKKAVSNYPQGWDVFAVSPTGVRKTLTEHDFFRVSLFVLTRQESLCQASRGFGAPYRGFPAFLAPSNCLKITKLRRLILSQVSSLKKTGLNITRLEITIGQAPDTLSSLTWFCSDIGIFGRTNLIDLN